MIEEYVYGFFNAPDAPGLRADSEFRLIKNNACYDSMFLTLVYLDFTRQANIDGSDTAEKKLIT